MSFVTWDGGKYVSIHREDCGHLGKRGGGLGDGTGKYKRHKSYAAAREFADGQGREVKVCHTCDPRH